MEISWKLLRVLFYASLFSGMMAILIHRFGKQRTYNLVMIGLVVILGIHAYISLGWKMELDSPLYLFTSNMMLHDGIAPFTGFYDGNPVGTHIFYYLHVLIYGTSDFMFRIADLIWLGLTLLFTYGWMRKVDKNAAVLGCLLFGLLYLRSGPPMSLERDYIIILPLSIAMCITLAMPRLNLGWKAFLVGFLFAITVQIKPQSGIGLPILLFYIARDSKPWKEFNLSRFIGLGLLTAAGFAIPVAAGYYYLYSHGALHEFNLITKYYWPKYNALNNLQQYTPHRGLDYYLPLYFRFGEWRVWVLTAVLGFYAGYWNRRKNPESQSVLLIAILAVAYSLYTVVAGKFWEYHWIIWLYFTVLLSACMGWNLESNWKLPWHQKLPKPLSTLSVINPVFIVLILILLGMTQFSPMTKITKMGPKKGRVDRMANYLKGHMKPGDMVQPLDWTGGVLQAMLMNDAKLPTRFMYDSQFYHNISEPYIQGLRSEFIAAINKTNPRYFIEVTAPDKPYASGPDTTRDFPELQEILRTRYQVVMLDKEFIIYERVKSQPLVSAGLVSSQNMKN